ncbi:MAG: hypothetical protein PHH82_03425 [Candidatus ainarchaeum sp.]|nr:hypothetical protein [Candidatus ainarchaeum sp.]
MKQNNSELQTISFRGNREIWLRFVYISKLKGEKRVWNVLKKMISKYFESGEI